MSTPTKMPTPQTPSLSRIDHRLGRYECTEGSHNKFWECLHVSGQRYDAVFCIRWGKIGAKNPQSQQLNLFEAERRINQKCKEYKHIPSSEKTLQGVQKQAISAAVSVLVEQKTPANVRPKHRM